MKWIVPFALALQGCTAAAPDAVPQTLDVATWVAREAVPLDDAARAFHAFEATLRGVRVLGLGESTHGQHESFELRRALTLQLVWHGGARLVLFESSAARARATAAYVSGASGDLEAAMAGLGMLVWQVEEVAALLQDLRAWNLAASPADRVRFAGIDVQDPEAAARRIGELVGGTPELVARLSAWGARIEPAVRALWSGDAADYHALTAEVVELEAEVRALGRASAELELRLLELRSALTLYHSPGGRDRALAELLLRELEDLPRGARALVWAHGAHVSRGPLRYLGTDELAMGGHVAAALGDAYYALGATFGTGEFLANALGPDGRFGFRVYRLSPAPAGSLDAVLSGARSGSFLLDLRVTPASGPVHDWAWAEQGHRWFGGYGIRADVDTATREAAALPRTIPAADFDGFMHLARTRATRPRERSLILAELPGGG
ncbi:MAG: erythromycin esterase family protein [Planctomycetes bacterium]|nr:erythromycin esterase family protein [Planctomycetota bacterium]